MKKLNKDNKGFSLVELLVVIAIMVVLVGVIAPTLLGNIEKSRVSADIQALDAVAGAIQDSLADENAYSKCMETAGTVYTVKSIYDTASGDKFADVVKEYLGSQPSMKGTEANSKSTTYTMYYMVNTNGQVAVWLASEAYTPTGTTAKDKVLPTTDNFDKFCVGKGTTYLVTR